MCLFAVLLISRCLSLLGRDVAVSPWSPLAYLWQDAVVALVFAILDAIVRRRRFGWTIYALLVGYVAINVPLVHVTSSPLTWPMLNATSSALSDSIQAYVTPANIGLMLGVVVSGVLVPRTVRRVSLPVFIAMTILFLLLAGLGPVATRQVTTNGYHRNCVVALANSMFSRIESEHSGPRGQALNWHDSPMPERRGTIPSLPLKNLRGAGKDFNVVLVILESAGAQYLKPYGATNDPMPTFTALADRSILFENAYTVYPESVKGLVSVLNSRFPAFDTRAEQYEAVGSVSLASVLGGRGYRTSLFHSGRFMYLGMDAVVARQGFGTLEDAGHISGVHESSFGVDEESTVDRLLQWIDEGPESSRFFAAYMPIAGHHPYDTPRAGPYPESDEINRYRNALHYADSALDRLITGLGKRRLLNETMLIIVGDHGQAFGQHDGNIGHTFFIYEENIHIPFLIRLPGMEINRRIKEVTSVIDLAPTILDILDVNCPASFQGRSLLRSHSNISLFFTDYSLPLVGLRDGPWKFIHEIESGRSLLFELEHDRAESNNLADQHVSRVQTYRDHLMRWLHIQRQAIVVD